MQVRGLHVELDGPQECLLQPLVLVEPLEARGEDVGLARLELLRERPATWATRPPERSAASCARARTSSRAPDVRSPTTPSTCPACSVRSSGWTAPSTDRPCTESTSGPAVRCVWSRSGRLRSSIARTRSSASARSASTTSTTTPSRMTATRSERAVTSSSRWAMCRIEQPRSRSSRAAACSCEISRSLRTADTSSKMTSRAPSACNPQHLGEGLPGRVEVAERALEVEVEAAALEHLHPAHELLLAGGLRERGVPEHVLDDGHLGRDGEVLLDDADAGLAGLRRALGGVRRPVEQHRALARRQLAADGLDERRLAGPVASDEADDLGPADGEVEPAQHVPEPAVLVQSPDLQQRVRHRPVRPPECLAGTPSPGPATR